MLVNIFLNLLSFGWHFVKEKMSTFYAFCSGTVYKYIHLFSCKPLEKWTCICKYRLRYSRERAIQVCFKGFTPYNHNVWIPYFTAQYDRRSRRRRGRHGVQSQALLARPEAAGRAVLAYRPGLVHERNVARRSLRDESWQFDPVWRSARRRIIYTNG